MADPELLRHVPIFSTLSEEQLASIAKLCHERSFAEDEWCFETGDPARSMYVLRQGRVALVFPLSHFWEEGGHVTIEMIEPGDVFGWSAVVPPYELTLSARCVGPCTTWTLPRDELLHLFEREPQIGYQVLSQLTQVIADRLRMTQRKLVLELGTALLVDGR